MTEYLHHLLKKPKKVQELQNTLRDPSVLSALYGAWRKGTLIVDRTWGEIDSPSQQVIYKPDSCLLPDDILQISEVAFEKKKTSLLSLGISIRSEVVSTYYWTG